MRIEIPKTCEYIINTLNERGYKTYVVGGCVRDTLLGREPKDWDLCTSANPKKVMEIFEGKMGIVETGLKHGTITLTDKDAGYEVTTFRTDGVYSDGRHPDSVDFTDDLRGDLSRRDFTINAMAYNHSEGLIDYFEGQKDLECRTIRCVGDPEKRFREDALRMLRAIRFATRLGFGIDKNIDDAIRDNITLLAYISKERIRDEFNKIIMDDNFISGITLLMDWGFMWFICPEMEKTYKFQQYNTYHCYDVWEHTLKAMEISPKNLIMRLSVFFHDVGKPFTYNIDGENNYHFWGHPEKSAEITKKALQDLKYDNDTIKKVYDRVLNHDKTIDPTKKAIKKLLSTLGEETLRDLLDIRVCDVLAQTLKYAPKRLEKVFKSRQILDEVLRDKECFTKKDLSINGNDLLNLGLEGKEIGDMLDNILDMVIENPEMNDKETLINMIKHVRGIYV